MPGDYVCKIDEDSYFCYFETPTDMKKVLAFIALVAFLSACTQYTCPTYSKKEVKKPATNRI
jgi:hypothetical protein